MREVLAIGVLEQPCWEEKELKKDAWSVDLQVRAVEALPVQGAAEAIVVAELAIVFARPSLRSQVVGVLKRGDTVTVDSCPEDVAGDSDQGVDEAANVTGWGAATAASGFLRIHVGSWIRQPVANLLQSRAKSFEHFFQSEATVWVLFRLPGQGRQPQVARVEPPRQLLRLEVVSDQVLAQPCRQGVGAEQRWRKGDIIEAAELLPDGWARIVRSLGASARRDTSPKEAVSTLTRTSYVLNDEGVEQGQRLLVLPTVTEPRAASVSAPVTKGEVLPSTPRRETPLLATPPKTPPVTMSPLARVRAWSIARAESLKRMSLDNDEAVPDLWSPEPAAPVTPIRMLASPEQPPLSASAQQADSSIGQVLIQGADGDAGAPLVQAQQQEGASSNFSKKPAAFFGICDLKYDARLPPGRRVIVLELGNGRSSRFSGHGEHVRLAFEKNYRLVKSIDRAALVDNKKMTHDVFVECGLQHLRPPQKAFSRCWTPDLPTHVASELAAGRKDSIVLKLVNRCRGAGVVVARVGDELKSALRRLLVPSEDSRRGGVPSEETTEVALKTALVSNPCGIEEQALHWWSNECPIFVAEKCMSSQPVEFDGQHYDATMRIGFVLVRSKDTADPNFRVEYLGGYWKLPAAPTSSKDGRARCVSKARSGTAPVSCRDLQNCYEELSEALPQVFAIDKAGASSIITRYKADFLLFGFTLARQAAEQVKREGRQKAKEMTAGCESLPTTNNTADASQSASVRCLTLAKRRLESKLPPEFSSFDKETNGQQRETPLPIGPILFGLSYVERQLGVVDAYNDDWESAVMRFHRSLLMHPLNATSEYLIGVHHMKQGDYQEARARFVRSLRLDPEFKAAYVNLSMVAIALQDWSVAITVSEAGLKRHPHAFQCNYNLGLALGYQLQNKLASSETGPLNALARRSVHQLRAAKEQKEQAKSDWNSSDEDFLNLLESLWQEFGMFSSMTYISRAQCLCWSSNLRDALSRLSGWSQINFRP